MPVPPGNEPTWTCWLRRPGGRRRNSGLRPPPSPWLPPLPAVITLEELRASAGPARRGAGAVPPVAYAVQDLPASQSRRTLVLDLDLSGHLLVVGGPRSGRTTLLRTLAGSLASGVSSADVHVYVL